MAGQKEKKFGRIPPNELWLQKERNKIITNREKTCRTENLVKLLQVAQKFARFYVKCNENSCQCTLQFFYFLLFLMI